MRKRRKERQTQYRSPVYRDLQRRLATNVSRLRGKAKLTQEAMAHRCEMSTRLLQRIEAGDVNATLTTIARLCRGLSVDVGQLFRS